MTPYREGQGDPDLGARESDAIREFGAWSARVRFVVLLVAALAGVAVGFWVSKLSVDIWQTEVDPAPPRIIYVGMLALTLLAFVFVGRSVGKALVRRRTPAILERLSAKYEVPAKRLAETTDLANQL